MGLSFVLWITSAGPQNEADLFIFPMPSQHLLSGTFGELRHGHFHAGLDIRTEGRTGFPVVAARAGYVYRAAVSHTGYGKVVYVRHPDNSSTVYAHLERFEHALEAKFRARQMAKRQFNQELFFRPHEFRVQQGQLLGFSGNTGASGGPHLHFEVRDADGFILNPMRYFKDWIPDSVPPLLARVGFEPLSGEARVNGLADKLLCHPGLADGVYAQPGIVKVRGPFGLEFAGHDRLQGAYSFNGLYSAAVYLDGLEVFSFQMDRFGFQDGRHLYSHIDYGFYAQYNTCLQRCYVQPGNRMPIYGNLVNNGIINLADDEVHELKLVIADYHGNRSTFVGRVQRDESPDHVTYTQNPHRTLRRASLRRGHLLVEAPAPRTPQEAMLHYQTADNHTRAIPLQMGDAHRALAIIKIDTANLPQQITYAGWAQPLRFHYKSVIRPGQAFTYRDTAGLRLYLPANALLETTPLSVRRTESPDPRACSDVVEVGDPRIPLAQHASLFIPPNSRGAQHPPGKLVMVELKDGNAVDALAMNPTGSGILRNFGRYCLMADREGPTLRPLNFRPGIVVSRTSFLSFRLLDDIAGVNPYSVQAWLDNQWQVVEYHAYQDVAIFYVPHGTPPGAHSLKLQAADNVGNLTSQSVTFVVR